MYAQVEKSKENKSRAAANSAAQKKGNNELNIGFTDNRLNENTQLAKQKVDKSNLYSSRTINSLAERKSPVQLVEITTEKDQSYDKNGNHLSQGQTNPPNVVNALNNTYSEVISDISGTPYHNAHMMAATFGGGNTPANIAAWNENMEDGWSEAENKIRGQSLGKMKAPRKNEQGTIMVTVNMPEDWSGASIGEALYDTASPIICDPANWTTVVGPGLGPTQNDLSADDQLKGVFAARVNNDINNALIKMPDNAKIEYTSSAPDDKRKFKKSFQNRDEIANPQISEDEDECASLISRLNLLPARSGRRLRNDL